MSLEDAKWSRAGVGYRAPGSILVRPSLLGQHTRERDGPPQPVDELVNSPGREYCSELMSGWFFPSEMGGEAKARPLKSKGEAILRAGSE